MYESYIILGQFVSAAHESANKAGDKALAGKNDQVILRMISLSLINTVTTPIFAQIKIKQVARDSRRVYRTASSEETSIVVFTRT